MYFCYTESVFLPFIRCKLFRPFGIGCLCVLFFGWISESEAATKASDFTPFTPYENEFAAAIIMQPKTHQVLYTFKPHLRWSAASLSKLSSALVVARTQPAWSALVRLKQQDEVGGGRLRVAVGARMSMKDLLYSSIVGSANNAAMAMARATGLSSSVFMKRVNAEVAKLGATHSIFVDPSGMDSKNMTTAHDMALIAETAFHHPVVGPPARSITYSFTVRNTGQKKLIKNTNSLLTDDPDVWIYGGKTGYLEESRYNFVAEMRPFDARGKSVASKQLIIVVLGASTKEGSFATAKRMAQWAWKNYAF